MQDESTATKDPVGQAFALVVASAPFSRLSFVPGKLSSYMRSKMGVALEVRVRPVGALLAQIAPSLA